MGLTLNGRHMIWMPFFSVTTCICETHRDTNSGKPLYLNLSPCANACYNQSHVSSFHSVLVIMSVTGKYVVPSDLLTFSFSTNIQHLTYYACCVLNDVVFFC